MKSLISQINKLKKSKIKKIIGSRIKEFKELKNKSNKEWFSELCFCIMTANFKAKECISMQKELEKQGFHNWDEKKLAKFLKQKGHRFWPQRAERIVLARKHCNTKDILSKQKNPREWLVENIKGLGYKEASHLLRNIGYDNYAILDRHILSILTKEGIIKEIPKTLTKKMYLEIEKKLIELGNKVDLTQAELDLYIWYIKTGKVLK